MKFARNHIRANWHFPNWPGGPSEAPKYKEVMLDFWIHDFVFPFLAIHEDPRQEMFATVEERDVHIDILKPNNEKVKTKEEEAEEAKKKAAEKAAEEAKNNGDGG